MGPTFGGFLIANVFWIRWSAVLDAVAARIGTARDGARRAATTDLPTTTL
jgi:hypothetical protein